MMSVSQEATKDHYWPLTNIMRRAPELILDILISAGIAIILLSPFPYGTVETWSVSLFEIVSFLTLGVWCLREILNARFRLTPSPLYLPMGLFFILIIIQLIPMPLTVLNSISPHTHSMLHQITQGLNYIFGETPAGSFTITINSYATREKLLLYLSYAAFFIVVSNYLVTRNQLKRYFWIIFAVGLIQSLIGIAQYISSGSVHPASGTYINPNHFGGLLILIIPLSLSYILYLGQRKRGVSNLVEIIRQSKFSNQLLLLFATCLMGTGLIMSQSRGALISAMASIAVFYVLLSWKKKNQAGTLFIAVFIAIIAIYSVWIGIDPVIEKFSETSETLPKRTFIWQDTLAIIKDFPIFGTGLGTYSLSFSLYKNVAHWPTIIQHAHNDYLELLSETGVAGFLLVMWGIIMFYKRALSKIVRNSSQNDPLRYYLLLGAISGLLGMMVHVITDFNFQLPANAYYFAFLLGISTSIINYSRSRRSKSL